MPSSERGPPLVRHLLLFSLALVLPVLVFVAVMFWQYVSSERAAAEAEARERARDLAVALDREVKGLLSAVQALATSPSLQNGDFEAFHRQAFEVKRTTGSDVSVRDRTGQQQVNTRLPWGAALPVGGTPDVDRTVLDTRQATISDLRPGAVARRLLIIINTPVWRNGEIALFLNLTVEPEQVLQVLLSENLPTGWTAAMIDREDRVIARSRDHDQHVGKEATPDLRRNATGQEGFWLGQNLDGDQVLGAYARSRVTGWRAVVGVPRSALEAPLRRSLWLLSSLGLATLLLSSALAYLFGRRIASPIASLAQAAGALGRGEGISVPGGRVRELNQVARALETSAATLRDREAALRTSEEQLRLTVEGAKDYVILTTDTFGQITSWSPGAEAILGWSAAEIVGKPAALIFTPEDRAQGTPERELAAARRDGHAPDERWHFRKDGRRVWLNGAVRPLHDPQGRERGFVKIARDDTLRREAAESLHQINETLESRVEERTAELKAQIAEREKAEAALRQSQKMEAIGRLTGGVAHDFNNLLTVIIGRNERMRGQLAGDARLVRDIDAIAYAADRAATLTHRLLAFSRQQPLDERPVEINKLVGGMSDLLRQTLGEEIQVETVLAGGLWRVRIDPNQLENAILNLAVNARDAMGEGGKLTIETANSFLDEAYAREVGADVLPGQYVVICVSDTGSGMPPEVIARAFDPFFTTKPEGEGTGLGLSMVYGFVKQSGGHAKIYSEDGQGTTIKLYLPRLRGDRPAPAAAEDTSNDAPVSRKAETVLVVEDQVEVRRFSAETLRELGYTVIEAEDGAGGLDLLDRHPEVVLLFTDVGLPGGMNGRALADEALRRRPDLRVLFTTGYARNAIVHHGRLDADVELLTKPFSHAGLAQKVRQVLDA